MRLTNLHSCIYTILLLFFVSCTTEDETITAREYPRLNTLPVTEVSEGGARFNAGFLMRGTTPIVEYGFTYSWNYEWAMDFEKDKRISVMGDPGDDGFSELVEQGLYKGENYNVKAFVRTDDFVVLGQVVNFESRGSKISQLGSFSPKIGHVLDEMEITSSDFGVNGDTYVEIDGIRAQITSYSRNVIKILVPEDLDKEEAEIVVSTYGHASSFKEKFKLYRPVINSISPSQVITGEELNIIGGPFDTKPGAVYVTFASSPYKVTAEILNVTEDQVTVRVPERSRFPRREIEVTMNNMRTIYHY